MKLTKKAAALLLAASLAVSVCATPVFAAGGTGADKYKASATGEDVTGTGKSTTASTDVEYVVTASYEWSVPSKITFREDTAEVEANSEVGYTQKVKVTKNIIPNKKKLQITVSSDTTKEIESKARFAIKTTEDAYLIYAIKKGSAYTEEIDVGGEVMSVESGKKTADTPLKFFLTKDTANGADTNVSEKAGTYTGIATFTAQLVDDTTV